MHDWARVHQLRTDDLKDLQDLQNDKDVYDKRPYV